MRAVRPILIQPDSVSRKRPFSTGYFVDWIFWALLLIVSRVVFVFFALLLEAVCVGVLLYGSRKSFGSSVLRAFSASNACFACDEPLSKRIGGVGLSRKLPRLRSWRCTQPRAAKATAGVAVTGNMTLIPRAAAIVGYTLLEGGATNALR